MQNNPKMTGDPLACERCGHPTYPLRQELLPEGIRKSTFGKNTPSGMKYWCADCVPPLSSEEIIFEIDRIAELEKGES